MQNERQRTEMEGEKEKGELIEGIDGMNKM